MTCTVLLALSTAQISDLISQFIKIPNLLKISHPLIFSLKLKTNLSLGISSSIPHLEESEVTAKSFIPYI